MNVKSFADAVLLPSERDVLKVHLYFKMIQYGIRPFENDIDIIVELYLFGGYATPDEQRRFIEHCLSLNLKKSPQSLRNTLSKYVAAGVFNKRKNAHLSINEKFIPYVKYDKILLEHKISHAN